MTLLIIIIIIIYIYILLIFFCQVGNTFEEKHRFGDSYLWINFEAWDPRHVLMWGPQISGHSSFKAF